MTAALLGGFLLLLVGGVPVAFALAIAGFSMMFVLQGALALPALPNLIYESLSSFTLTAIPLFILMANVLIRTRVSQDLYRLVYAWFGNLPGGAALTTAIFSGGFAAISGSSVASASTIGTLTLPEMLRAGCDRRFAYGIIAAGGTVGILIPPSLFMILYGSLTDESVGALFIAGVVPGVLMTFAIFAYAVLYSLAKGYRGAPRATWRERARALRAGLWGLALPVIVIGGIYTGVFTPTEAAAVGVVYSLTIGLASRRLQVADLRQILLQTTSTTVMIFFIIIGAVIFGHVVTMLQVPQQAIAAMSALGVSPLAFVLLMCLVFLVLGAFLEVVSVTLITLPIVYPILLSLQIDPIWFAVVMCINMEIALVTPPVGLNLFVIQGIDRYATSEDVFVGVLPFIAVMALVLAIVIAMPSLSTWLPRLMQ
ncbi:MAG: TRAP transporter large permease [Burkholderiaceae bacterium]|nr:TRAP transporter large permease [Burkholderiaceae bacterium]